MPWGEILPKVKQCCLILPKVEQVFLFLPFLASSSLKNTKIITLILGGISIFCCLFLKVARKCPEMSQKTLYKNYFPSVSLWVCEFVNLWICEFVSYAEMSQQKCFLAATFSSVRTTFRLSVCYAEMSQKNAFYL